MMAISYANPRDCVNLRLQSGGIQIHSSELGPMRI